MVPIRLFDHLQHHRRVARLAFAAIPLAVAASLLGAAPPAGAATPAPMVTTSLYEMGADPSILAAQGTGAGQVGSEGLVILDFGRPAADGTVPGMITHDDGFVPLTAVATAVESYVQAYFEAAPAYARLDVAIGTNNSCGTGQPCGRIICGCNYEPASFSAWGADLAATVQSARAWTASLKAEHGYTDTVSVIAGDDAEPAYDPAFQNTHDVLAGYAAAVGGYQPAMVDYGSADAGFWTEAQLLQVADGFAPDVLVPELYYPSHIQEWAALLSYARAQGRTVTVFGVLTTSPTGNSATTSYTAMLDAIAPITGQTSIPWTSNIGA